MGEGNKSPSSGGFTKGFKKVNLDFIKLTISGKNVLTPFKIS